MLPVYKELQKHKIEILVYSGDVDAIVPVCISSLDTRFSAQDNTYPGKEILLCLSS